MTKRKSSIHSLISISSLPDAKEISLLEDWVALESKLITGFRVYISRDQIIYVGLTRTSSK